jgi:arylsulfatase A-like enzyme
MKLESLVAHLKHPALSRGEQREQLDLVQSLNRLRMSHRGDKEFNAHIRSMELAFQMQAEATEAFDVSREPEYVHERYGQTTFAQSCLLGRRLLDTHADNDNKHRTLCADSDRATAALLADLKDRGMLEDTLVVWGGEFGRTPYSQVAGKDGKGKPGRDHHATGFSMFLAGGGVRGGLMYGKTDELGMHAVQDRVHVHDLHATILHLMGIDHTRLTYRYSGRDFRLTDVYGRVVNGLLA